MNREEVAKWNEQRLAVEAEIRSLKSWIREGAPPARGPGLGTFEDYRQLEALKATATGLYVERASSRGRVHLRPAAEIQHEEIQGAVI